MVRTRRGGKGSSFFGIPTDQVRSFWSEWRENALAKLRFMVSPAAYDAPNGWDLVGTIEANVDAQSLRLSDRGIVKQQFEVTCRPSRNRETPSTERPPLGCDPFILRASILVKLVDGRFPSLEISLEPRAILQNMLPVSIHVRSPMPHVNGLTSPHAESDLHELGTESRMEIFTPGPSIAIMIKCTDMPVGGTPTGWMEGGWVDLPLVSEFALPEPLRCLFPFVARGSDIPVGRQESSEFFITQGGAILSDAYLERVAQGHLDGHHSTSGIEVLEPSSKSHTNIFYVTVCNYAVDHTGDVLFEKPGTPQPRASVRSSFSSSSKLDRSMSEPLYPLGAYATRQHRGRITLLPAASEPIRLLHLTMEGDEGVRRSMPFYVDAISICDGGVDATPLKWESGAPSGFYAYRQLLSAQQSEIHVVPEYIVFNGSKKDMIRVRQPGGLEFAVEPGSIAPLRTPSQETPVISVECVSIGGRTGVLRVDSLGLRVAVVRSPEGFPLGSLAIQTVVGGRDSRLVVKLGEVKFSGPETEGRMSSLGALEKDFLRFRVQWSLLQVSLFEARRVESKRDAFLESAMDRITEAASPSNNSTRSETWVTAREKQIQNEQPGSASLGPVCTILFHQCTVDWQRVFKDVVASTRQSLQSPERSQLSVIVRHIQIKDDAPESPFPIVFESTTNSNFFDLCIRYRGPLDAELVKVDLFDLNLAHAQGVSERMTVNTSEEFVWKFLDLANRILVAAAEFKGVDIQLDWDEKHDGYKVTVLDKKPSYIEDMTHYTPPDSDLLLDIARVRVSPFVVVVSFKRSPQASRYTRLKNVRGANIMNYFTRKLKFKIDSAELQFARYEVRHVKGPPDRLLELLTTVYASRMKFKFLTLMSATSFQDWKNLSNRGDGDDAFMEGDVLRATGNLAGLTANYLLKNTGRGLGHGVSFATGALGDGIEKASSAIGVKPVGAGVNRVVSGVGDGVAQSLAGGKTTTFFVVGARLKHDTLTLSCSSWKRRREIC